MSTISRITGWIDRRHLRAEWEAIGAKDTGALMALVDGAITYPRQQYAVAITMLLKAGVSEADIPHALRGAERIIDQSMSSADHTAEAAAEFLAAVNAIAGPLNEGQWMLCAHFVRLAQEIR